jgi:hypothetical protein
MEKIILIKCKNCKREQQTIIRTKVIIGKSRKCFYCNKNITITEENYKNVNT